MKPTLVISAQDTAQVSPPCMGATARTIARPSPWPSGVPRAQRGGDSDKVRGKAACAPQFDRQTADVLTRLELRREVAHARHDGALDLMRRERSR